MLSPGMPSASSPYVILGVMSNPMKPVLRDQWRQWATTFSSSGSGVHVKYVLGKTIYQRFDDQGASTAELPELSKEITGLGKNDILYVAGREQLPHVGVVTEKSAYFWQTAVKLDSHTRWFCKCDDDTLVHLDRLESTLRYVCLAHVLSFRSSHSCIQTSFNLVFFRSRSNSRMRASILGT